MLRSLTLVIILFTAFGIWIVFAPQELEQPARITIEQGASVDDILAILEDAGVIDNEFLAKVYIKAKGAAAKLQAGEYTFENSINLAGVLEKLTAAKNPENELTLTFIEGWTLEDMARYIDEQESLRVTGKEFMLAASRRYDAQFVADIPNSRNLEGYLFPDTYRVYEDVTADELVRKMIANFTDKIDEDALTAINASGRTVDEVVILASILERELLTLEDRKKGADVFLKRLEAGIALQADSTVNYITKKKTPSVTYEDLEIDSPYNTYMYRGLPPGPISNPGADSIVAAIYPISNPYYYFLTTQDGEALFNATLEGHNADKATHL